LLLHAKAGLPDGLFSDQKSQSGYILDALATEDVYVVYGHLVYFTAIWYILWKKQYFCGNLVHLTQFWSIIPRKSGNPAQKSLQKLLFL
jgi:hypothetical protein